VPNDDRLPHPGLLVTMVIFSAGWIMVALEWGGWGGRSSDMPYVGWWIAWLLIAVAAVPVFVAVIRLHRDVRDGHSLFMSLVAFSAPPVAAAHLLGLVGACANWAAVTGYGDGGGCPAHPGAIGWLGLWFGFGVLWSVAIFVLKNGQTHPRAHA